MGFPRGLFPTLWCFPPRCLGLCPLRFLCRALLLAFMCCAISDVSGIPVPGRPPGHQHLFWHLEGLFPFLALGRPFLALGKHLEGLFWHLEGLFLALIGLQCPDCCAFVFCGPVHLPACQGVSPATLRAMAGVLHQNPNWPKILSNGSKNDKPTLIVFAQQSLPSLPTEAGARISRLPSSTPTCPR